MRFLALLPFLLVLTHAACSAMPAQSMSREASDYVIFQAKSVSSPIETCAECSSIDSKSKLTHTNAFAAPSASSAASAQAYEKVTEVRSEVKEQTIYHIALSNGQTLEATAGHPFKTQEGWRDAIMLKKGGKLLLKGSEEDSERFATITDIREEVKTIRVYNLEVRNLHTFYVGEDGVVVHNGAASTKCWTDAKGRKQVVATYGSRKEAKRAAENSPAGLWSNQPDPAHGGKGKPHFHDNNHTNPSKPNIHYEF